MTAPSDKRADNGAASARPRRRASLPGRPPGITYERRHWDRHHLVAGVDEVGRGAWAGPVSVGVVVLDPGRRIQGLRDSKVLRPDVRAQTAARIQQSAIAVAVGHASNDEIDRVGMTSALRLATSRALECLTVTPHALLIDGNLDFVGGAIPMRETIVKGDRHSASIAAASIVAKVTRDSMMVEHDPHHPQFRFAANKGYPAPAHRQALAVHGPCRLHRHSWAPIQALLQPTLFELSDPAVQVDHPAPESFRHVRTAR